MKKKLKFNSRAIHGGQILDPAYGSVMTPIYQTSTYAQTSPGVHKGYEYSRTHNPTRTNFERSIASLENGNYGLAFASGLAAIDAIVKTLDPGDEIISTNDLYGGSYRLFKQIFEKYDLKFHFVNMENLDEVSNKINKKTKLIWAETPTNPNDEQLYNKLSFIQNASGATPGPMDCFLTIRGIKTLHLRMQRHSENAEKVAIFLRNHDKIGNVYWAGFSDNKNYKIAEKQMP